jgi:hypothetical protein
MGRTLNRIKLHGGDADGSRWTTNSERSACLVLLLAAVTKSTILSVALFSGELSRNLYFMRPIMRVVSRIVIIRDQESIMRIYSSMYRRTPAVAYFRVRLKILLFTINITSTNRL